MRRMKKAVLVTSGALATAALSGLFAGSASANPLGSQGITNPSTLSYSLAGTQAFGGLGAGGENGCGGKDGCGGKHDCKGKNECKGKGGCKSGDNGCKGKNSCKGKGGCATDGSHEEKH